MDQEETAVTQTMIYLHIPKCAGSSMMALLRRNYGAGFYRCPNGGGWRKFGKVDAETREAITCLTGHIPWGLHRYLPGPHRYAVMLRDPVDRVVSLYWFIRQFTGHKWHKLARKRTLLEFVTSRAFADLDNGMTRWLAGREDVGRMGTKRGLQEDDLIAAMGHLDTMTVGFVDEFGASVLKFAETFGWKHTAFEHKMTGQYPVPTVEQRRMIEQYNLFDVALYEYARKERG